MAPRIIQMNEDAVWLLWTALRHYATQPLTDDLPIWAAMGLDVPKRPLLPRGITRAEVHDILEIPRHASSAAHGIIPLHPCRTFREPPAGTRPPLELRSHALQDQPPAVGRHRAAPACAEPHRARLCGQPHRVGGQPCRFGQDQTGDQLSGSERAARHLVRGGRRRHGPGQLFPDLRASLRCASWCRQCHPAAAVQPRPSV
ncbi:hypothetical protein P3T32_001289 [Ralstonia sp. GP73]|uniref:Uncharacterized protein n=1 Tax=Ralstonia thomasii TaxID=3058596 RepID=A0ABM9J8L8_9RALS|nr:hypothetical protein [Ralstonia sp. GP73]CAJ0717347.1 hypothetical protein LMG7143_04029 [Ralstonia sp. LMG 18095]CAJ0786095.1 hypothetical protein LMG18095_01401 [Ralstonia sp. LMG 18095]